MFILPLKEQARLTTLLSQSHRYYHNINHINFCLAQLELVPNLEKHEEVVVTYAIWYHDAIYNPYSSKNEEQSAALYRLTHKDDLLYVREIEDAILETAHHTTDLIEPTHTTALMLDIDLAGLGQSWETFADNSEDIRLEYNHLDDETFIRGRIKFLEAMKARKSLYYTKFFHHTYELVAQTNVDSELKRLYTIL